MTVRSIIAALLIALFLPTRALAETWIRLGVENGRHVAANLDSIPGNESTKFRTTIALVPFDWPANGYAYSVVLATFDCAGGTRTVTQRIEYSSLRDPLTSEFSDRSTVSRNESAAVRNQLNLLCNETSRGQEQHYSHLGALIQGL